MFADQQLISSRTADDVVNGMLFQISSRMLDLTEDLLLIHAGSVVSPSGDGVLLPGDPGSGKSTLVTGLIRAGFGFLSDEVGVIDHLTGVLHPYPRALNLKKGALAIFPELWPHDQVSAPSHRYIRAEQIRPGIMAVPREARFVIAPMYREGAATQVTALSPGETVKELWANVMNRSAFGARATLPVLAEVARQARGYQVVSGYLGEAVEAVADLTGPSRTGP